MKKILILLLIILSSFVVQAQSRARIMTYNILNYTDYSTDYRNIYFQKIIASVNPDILVVQEIKTQSSVDQFLGSILSSKYKSGTFIPNTATNETNNAIFYKDSLFKFISNYPIVIPADPGTSERDISEFKMVHNFTKDTLRIYSAHLKSSTGSTNEQRRLKEVTKLLERTATFPANSYCVVVGDFNIYTTLEPAYKKITDAESPGYFIDPITITGTYNHPLNARYHTQSTRYPSLPDGGASGGLDDRFDFLMISPSLNGTGKIKFNSSSYTALGNDGDHYDRSINDGINTVVSKEIADALYYASDHLPVFADFDFEINTSITKDDLIENSFVLYQNYPNPFNPTTTIRYSVPANVKSEMVNVTLKIFDVLGREVATIVDEYKQAGIYNCEWRIANGELPSGIYFYTLKTGNSILARKMTFLK